jgi:hypothetical protein
LNGHFELPSLEEIEETDRQRLQAFESLQISDGFVNCQGCGIAVPMLRTLTKPKSNRIAVLQKQIKWIEEHYHYPHRPYGNINNSNKNKTIITSSS